MITVIDQGEFHQLKKLIDHLPPISAEITLILNDKQHQLIHNQETFELNYHSSNYQRLLGTQHPLLKAIGQNPGTILDACGGLGKDSFILTHQGHHVTTCESNLIIYSLLAQAIKNYCENTDLKWLYEYGNCHKLMQEQVFDTIYLDPMFTVTRSAKPKLAMQMIQQLVRDEPFTNWNTAWQSCKKRLVIKHHQKTPSISSLPKPSISIKGKRNVRYDIYTKA